MKLINNTQYKIEDCYNSKTYDQPVTIKAKIAQYPDPFDVELMTGLFNAQPDCKIGHFGYNFYFRTNAGLNYQKYKSFQYMARAVARTALVHGLTVEYITIDLKEKL